MLDLNIQDRSVFKLSSVQPHETIYYGQDKQNNCADVFYSSKQQNNILVILLHGGYWQPIYNRQHLRPFAAAIAQAGFDTINIEYRRILGDPDIYIKDSIQAVKILPTKLKRKYKKIILIGHSVGGFLAYHVLSALKKQQIKSILLGPALNLQRIERQDNLKKYVIQYLDGPVSSRKDLDPFQFNFYPTTQITIFQGLRDTLVPASFTEEFMKKYAEKDPETCKINYIQFPSKGHYEFINPEHKELFNLIIEQISKMMTPK